MKIGTIRALSLFLLLCLSTSVCSCTESTEEQSSTDSLGAPVTETEIVTEPEQTAPVITTGDGGADFVLDIPQGRDIRILQLTDTQTTALDKTRNNTRYLQLRNAYFSDNITDHEIKTYRYIREAVEKSNPDLIILTGDIIYGETDDDGSLWLEMCALMDSFKIPWAVAFGNHDNESAKGVNWQISILEDSEYCLFSRGSVTGNSNYNIVLRQGGEYKYIIYMLDTNGCHVINNPGEGIERDNVDINLITQQSGIYDDQIEWFKSSAQKIASQIGHEVPSLAYFHIAPKSVDAACSTLYDKNGEYFDATREGDFGGIYEIAGRVDADGKFFRAASEIGCTGMFFGHEHRNDASIVYRGIRLTFGVKTGTHTYWRRGILGGTLATISDGDSSLSVQHVYSDFE